MADRLAKSSRIPPFLAASLGLHGVALATVLANPRAWELALGLVVANHLGISMAAILPRCGWLGPNIRRLPGARARGELVSLTFDDGPIPKSLPRFWSCSRRVRGRHSSAWGIAPRRIPI